MNPEQLRKQNNDLLKRLCVEIDRIYTHFEKQREREIAIEEEMVTVQTNIKWLIRLVVTTPTFLTLMIVIYEVFLK